MPTVTFIVNKSFPSVVKNEIPSPGVIFNVNNEFLCCLCSTNSNQRHNGCFQGNGKFPKCIHCNPWTELMDFNDLHVFSSLFRASNRSGLVSDELGGPSIFFKKPKFTMGRILPPCMIQPSDCICSFCKCATLAIN